MQGPQGIRVKVRWYLVGRRQLAHRALADGDVEHLGVERCNVDDARRGKFPPRLLEVGPREDRGDGLPVGFPSERICKWCGR